MLFRRWLFSVACYAFDISSRLPPLPAFCRSPRLLFSSTLLASPHAARTAPTTTLIRARYADDATRCRRARCARCVMKLIYDAACARLFAAAARRFYCASARCCRCAESRRASRARYVDEWRGARVLLPCSVAPAPLPRCYDMRVCLRRELRRVMPRLNIQRAARGVLMRADRADDAAD